MSCCARVKRKTLHPKRIWNVSLVRLFRELWIKIVFFLGLSQLFGKSYCRELNKTAALVSNTASFQLTGTLWENYNFCIPKHSYCGCKNILWKTKNKGQIARKKSQKLCGKRAERENSKSNRSFRSRPKRNGGNGQAAQECLKSNNWIPIRSSTKPSQTEKVLTLLCFYTTSCQITIPLKAKKFVDTTEIKTKRLRWFWKEISWELPIPVLGKRGIPNPNHRTLYNKREIKVLFWSPRELAQQVETEFKALPKAFRFIPTAWLAGRISTKIYQVTTWSPYYHWNTWASEWYVEQKSP